MTSMTMLRKVRRRQMGRRFVSPEPLESRQLLTAMVRDNVAQLTMSFVPDGTRTGGQPSSLFDSFSGLADENVWQNTLSSALDTWLRELGSLSTVVPDQGLPLGTSGDDFGDSRFGDIRVAATELDSSVAAFAIPCNDTVSGTWAGDVLFNSDYSWQSLDEVFSIALHEFGHVLGLDHSSDPESVMFAHTGNQVMAPSAQDIADLHQLFGIGQTGSVEQETGNSHNIQRLAPLETTATDLNQRLRATATLGAGDVDLFEFTSPQGVRGATIELKYEGSAKPRVTLQSKDGIKIDAQVIVDQNGRFVLESMEIEGGKKYRVVVEDTGDNSIPIRTQLTVSFSSSPAKADRIVKGQVNRERTQQLTQLEIVVPQLFTFHLDVTASKKRTNAAVVLSVYDAEGTLCQQLAVLSGGFATGNTVLLQPGTYMVAVDAVAADTAKIPEMEFVLSGSSSSLPIGPGLTDPTFTPATTDPSLMLQPYIVILPISPYYLPPYIPPLTPASTTMISPWMMLFGGGTGTSGGLFP
ncbi:MAG: matrixin family metalloprotease [Planctomycetaceae bacterium]